MPGKQMSIDADLKAGIIDADAARERRSVLERKRSQLYGFLYGGAMKFIKGDAIAGIIAIFTAELYWRYFGGDDPPWYGFVLRSVYLYHADHW